MEAVIWILLPGFTAVASGLLAWFIMQSRMEVALARERERTAESRGALDAEKSALGTSLDTALRAAEAVAKREALEGFMEELRVEQRHYTRENRMLMQNRKSLVLQERMYFRNIPLSDWIEHEITVSEEGVWYLADEEIKSVEGCIDIDLNFSPITNLLPLRRLDLKDGDRESVSAAWLRFPSFTLERLEQTYSRIDKSTVKYESRDGEFVRDLKVNAAGLVLDYPDYWIAEADVAN